MCVAPGWQSDWSCADMVSLWFAFGKVSWDKLGVVIVAGVIAWVQDLRHWS